ncbi:MAG: TonB-dependent receptor [Pseudomonadota bacterium]
MKKTLGRNMKNLTRKILLGGVSLSFMMNAAAHAQEGVAEADGILSVIVVTAQKREQSIQDVPISMTVLTGQFIEKSSLDNIEEYALFTPSISADESAVDASDIRFRGVGALGGTQNTFGLYVDGFEITGGTSLGTTTRLLDVERLEVLRGPQGTAFGRNVVAGAVNITSKTPATDGYGGLLELGLENFGGYEVRGSFNAPLSDNTAVLLSGFYDRTDGFIKNIGASGGSNDRDELGVRLAIASTPTDRLSLKGSISYERREFGLANALYDGVLREGADVFANGVSLALGVAQPFSPGVFFPDNAKFVNLNSPTSGEIENVIAIGRADYDFGPATLVWVNGFIQNSRNYVSDIDNSQFDIASADISSENRFASTELRLQSNGDNRFDWIGGLYGSYEESDSPPSGFLFGSQASLLLPFLVEGAPFLSSASEGEQTGFAVFADGDFEFTDRLNVLAGVRYSYDAIERQTTQRFNRFGFPSDDIQGDTDDSDVTWRVSLVHELTDDVNTYATVSTGYRAGGFQSVNGEQVSFGSEKMTNYELGAKAFLFDRRVNLNFAAYFMDWQDVQIFFREAGAISGSTDNAGEAEIWGMELDAQIALIDHLNIFAGAGYTNSEFTDIDGNPGDERIGLPLPLAPEWTASLTADYQRPVTGQLEGFLRMSYIYKGEMIDELAPLGEDPLFYDSYDRIDVRVGITDPDSWRLEAYVENAENDAYITGQDINPLGLTGSSVVTQPQRYGVRFRKEFGAK